ncbi:PadR family transcriptional regulator [candidate division KSB1 bacterium]
MILLSRAEEIILISVWKLKDNAYGVTIREQVNNDIGLYWSFGVVYKTLHKMVLKGFLIQDQSEPSSERGGRSKYFYKLTKDGLEALKEINAVHSSLWSDIGDLTLE